MAGAADPDPPPPKTSLFLGCFRFSGKRSDNSSKIPDQLHPKRRRSTILLKQSAAATTTAALKKDSAVFRKSKSAALDVPLKPRTPPPVKAPEEQTPLETKSLDKRVTVEDGKVRNDCNGRISPTNGRAVSVSQPGPPDGSNRETMTRATSLPGRVGSKIPPREITANDKLEPVTGLSIIVVTLVMLLIWGRLCAILCTSTWLYLVSRPIRKTN